MESKARFSITFTEKTDSIFSYVLTVNHRTQDQDRIIAIWDTGCTATVITAALARRLKLKPCGQSTFRGLGATKQSPVYTLDVIIEPTIPPFTVQAVQTDYIDDETDMLIGMDIISTGDLFVTRRSGHTTFSFTWKNYK